jgi:hypothetical protein
MPALKNVVMWDDDHWEPVTAETASKLVGGIHISAGQDFFRCALCKQSVLLTRDTGVNQPHFRHQRGEDDQPCEDRVKSGVCSQSSDSKALRNIRLPLRCRQDGESFSLQLGIYQAGIRALLESQQNAACESINLSAYEAKIRSGGTLVARLGLDLIGEEGFSWLDLGSEPLCSYTLYLCDGNGKDQISHKVGGFSQNENYLFSSVSGKLLPFDADVEIGCPYLAMVSRLSTESFFHAAAQASVDIKKVLDTGMFSVLKVTGRELTLKTADFFGLFNARLTDKPVRMLSLWPPVVKGPYSIECQKTLGRIQQLIYVVGSDVSTLLYPSRGLQHRVGESHGRKGGKLHWLNIPDRRVMISSGRFSVLKYQFIRSGELTKMSSVRRSELIRCIDAQGQAIPEGTLNRPLLRDEIRVVSARDFTVEIRLGNKLLSRNDFRGGEQALLKLSCGTELKVRVGCERPIIIRRPVFQKTAMPDLSPKPGRLTCDLPLTSAKLLLQKRYFGIRLKTVIKEGRGDAAAVSLLKKELLK